MALCLIRLYWNRTSRAALNRIWLAFNYKSENVPRITKSK